MSADRESGGTVDVAEAVEALRKLNRAVWLDHPKWAFIQAETVRAADVIARYEAHTGRTP